MGLSLSVTPMTMQAVGLASYGLVTSKDATFTEPPSDCVA